MDQSRGPDRAVSVQPAAHRAATDEVAPPVRRGPLARLAGRAGWTVADQALSSLSSLLLSVFVARAVDASDFGAFTVAFAVYSVTVLLSRALVSQPLPIRFASTEPASFRRAAGASVGSALAVGLGIAVLVVLCGAALPGELGLVLVVMGVLIPGVLVQDAWRIAFFASGRPQWAAFIDGLWLAVQLLSVALLVGLGVGSPAPYLVGWGVAGLAGAALGCVGGRSLPRIERTRSWLRDHWSLTRYLLVESVLVQGAFQGSMLLVGALAALDDVAGLRGAQVLMGPVALLAMSAAAFAVPELARRPHLTGPGRMRIALLAGGALAAVGAVWCMLLLVLPDSVGEIVLGQSWEVVQPVLPAYTVVQLVNMSMSGFTYVLYARGETRRALRVNSVLAVCLVVFSLVGLAVGGIQGVVWGYALSQVVVLPLWAAQVRRIGEQPAPTGGEHP